MSCDDYEFVVSERVYIGHDNAVVITPYSDIDAGINYDLTVVTRIVAHADLITSTTSGDAIAADSDLSTAITWDDSATGNICAKVGRFPSITAGTYYLRITIYDPAHPNGFVLPGTDNGLRVEVIDAA